MTRFIRQISVIILSTLLLGQPVLGQVPNFESKRAALVKQLTETINGVGDQFQISQLPDQVSRDEAKRFATTVLEYVNSNAPLTDAQRTVLKGARQSGNLSVKAMAREVSWIKMMQVSVPGQATSQAVK